VEVGNVQGVLDGEIEPFVEAWLRGRLGERENGARHEVPQTWLGPLSRRSGQVTSLLPV
jgi:hypothetical protein